MKQNEKPRRLSRLTICAGKYKYLTYSALALSAASMVVSVIPYYYVWKIVNEILECAPDYGSADVVGNGIVALAFTAVSVTLYVSALMCSHYGAFNIARAFREKLVDHAMKLPMGTFDDVGSGKIRRTIQDTVAQTETYLAHILPDAAGTTVLPFAMIAMMLYFDWRLGAACMVMAAVAFAVLMTMASASAMKDRMGAMQTELDNMNKVAVEYVRGISIVKTFQQTVDSFESFKAIIDRETALAIEYTKWCRGRMMAFVLAIDAISAILILGGLWINGTDTADPEFLSDFIFYVIFAPLITVLLMKLMHLGYDGQIADASLDRVDELLSMKPLPEPVEPKEPEGHDIRFENVTFAYEGSETPAVDGFSLTMRSGTVTALVGASGSGKSTAASLACRFWDPQKGSVSIGGADLRDIGTKRVCELTSFVLQTNRLLKDTLGNNVRLAKPNATDEEVRNALHLAQCDDIVAKMPQGLDTIIGPGGTHLSGGETQRIAIARAILKDSPIIIMDEATAFTDPENEYLVQKAFGELVKNKTVLMIAHRLTTVRDADQICIMDGGRIVEVGTHPELVNMHGVYDRMWNDYQKTLSWKVRGASA